MGGVLVVVDGGRERVVLNLLISVPHCHYGT